MNSKDQEQVAFFQCYLLRRAERSRSRLIREQVRRWGQWVDTIQQHEREQRRIMNEELRRAA